MNFPRQITARMVAIAMGSAAGCLGASVLVTRFFAVPTFHILSGSEPMRASTATGMMLAGGALVLAAKRARKPWVQVAVAGIATAVIMLGALALERYLLRWEPSFTLWRLPPVQPPRPVTALCFVMTGTALLLSLLPRRMPWRSGFLAGLSVALLIIGTLALVGYFSEISIRVHWWNYASIGVDPALGIVLLGVGILACVKSESELRWALNRTITGGFVAAAVVLLTAVGTSVDFIAQVREAQRWVRHTHEVLKAIEDIRAGMAELESEQRGFIITGDERVLELRGPVQAGVSASLGQVRRLTADNPRQQRRIEELAPLLAQQRAFGDRTIAARRREGFFAAKELISSGTGLALTARINALLETMTIEERSLLVARDQQAETASSASVLLLPLGAFLSLAMLAIGLFLLNTVASDRARSEAQLQETEKIAKVGGWEFDAVSGDGQWTTEVARIHDLDPKVSPTREMALPFYVGESRDRIETAVKAAVEQGVPYDLELQMISAKGTPKWVRTIGHPMLEKGKVRKVRGSFQDITDRKQAELALQESEELFSKAFRLSPDCVVIVRLPDRTVIRANEATCRLWDRKPEEVIGQRTREYSTWVDEERRDEFLRALEVHGENLDHETTLRMADGRLLDFSLSARMILFHGDRCILTVMRDITAAKQAKAAGETSDKRYRALFEYAPDGIVIADAKGTYLDANASICGMLGRTRQEIIGMTAADIVMPAEMPHIGPALDVINSKSDYYREWRFRRKDGSSFEAEVIATAMPDGNLLALIRDITLRKAAEAEIQRLNAQLEQRVIERTAQLESANKELESFSYSVSHDLRSPLRAIDGFSEALEQECGESLSLEGKGYLQTIRQGSQRMGALIDDLLAFSRLGRQSITKRSVDTAQLVATVLEELQAAHRGRDVDIQIGPLEMGLGDPSLLKQVWINLLSNAFKYTRKRPQARVEIGCQPAANETVYFVRDNGTGFEMEYAHKLFGVFQRLHRAEDFEGTGVGLAIVQRIVQRHGGRVWAEAIPDQGATFYFTLPTGQVAS